MRHLLPSLLVVLGALAALPARGGDGLDPPQPQRPKSMIEKLTGQRVAGVDMPAPVYSNVTVEALGLLDAAQVKSASDSGVAPLGSLDQLSEIADYLRQLGAKDPEQLAADIYSIGHLSKQSLVALIQQGEDPNAPDFLKKLAELARMEAARRGLDVQSILNQPLGEPAPTPVAQQQGGGGDAQQPPMQASQSDLEMLARVIQGEWAEWAGQEGAIAIGAVVIHRVRDVGYGGNTIPAVISAPAQFSCYGDANYNRTPIGQWALDAAQKALDGVDPVPGATNYFNPVPIGGPPSWAANMTFVKKIGSGDFYHLFYKP